MPKVEAIVKELHDRSFEFLDVDLQVMADRVEHALRRERPELTIEAIHDLANHFAYAQK